MANATPIQPKMDATSPQAQGQDLSDRIASCIEEEYSLFPSYLWRRRNGWRPLFIYGRGPGGVPIFISPFLTLLGLWRFARRPSRMADIDVSTFLGATVISTDNLLGCYGMGGLGFVGLRMRLPRKGSTWVVFTVWGAAGWLTINDDLLVDGYFSEEQRELSAKWHFRRLADLIGASLTGVQVDHNGAELAFSTPQGPLVLKLRRDSSALPVHRGSKQPKTIAPPEDMRDAIITSRSGSLWLVGKGASWI